MQLSPSFITANEEKTAKLEDEKHVIWQELSKRNTHLCEFRWGTPKPSLGALNIDKNDAYSIV
jgi:hypothetical protein